ncbi:MAG: SpoIIE family protein phosphatase, partial [Acidobacteria bacterium]|nr:SpoIIE family protein phosphatase [Acidobacteriota bacterium]
IDQEVYKYVGVGGVDQERIVQIGNALVFGEQEILTNVYATERADVSAVVEGIVGQQMLVQATIVGHFVAAAEEAAWPAEEIEGRLRRIVGSTVIGEIRVVNPDGTVAYSTLLPPLAGGAAAGVPHAGELAPLLEGAERSVELATAPRASDGQVYKYVAVAGAGSPRVVQIGIPIEGSSGNLLYSVYQREADLLVRSRNLEALWVVNLDRELAAAAPRAGQAAAGTADAAGAFARRAEAVMGQAMEQGQVVSETSLSLLSPADRGIWVASPIINAGGIPIGGLALAVSLDDIANSVRAEARNTTLIAFVLLGFTAAAALWGTRWLTQPIEAIAAAARQVEMGRQPDEGPMETVMKRTDELGSLARVFEAMTVQVFNREEQLEMMVAARTDELQQSNRSLRLAQQALEQDLEMAKVVQAALVREGNVDLGGFAAYARMTPAQQVGGDFVDVLEPSGGKLFFTVCDVSGKGVAAALFMAASQGAINAAASESQSGDVGAIATEANRRLCAENPMGLFVTGVLAIVDLERAVMEYVCAGHEPAFLVAADDSRRPLPMTGGVAMGVLDDFRYESRKQKLAPGEALFLYTDGLTDAVNLTGELFGKERLEGTLDGASARSPEEIVDHVWSEIGTYSAGAPAADDMTCLVLRRRR